jgi:hypothetical protein
MVVEIGDSLERVEKFLTLLDQMIADGLVTLEKVRMIHYTARLSIPFQKLFKIRKFYFGRRRLIHRKPLQLLRF